MGHFHLSSCPQVAKGCISIKFSVSSSAGRERHPDFEVETRDDYNEHETVFDEVSHTLTVPRRDLEPECEGQEQRAWDEGMPPAKLWHGSLLVESLPGRGVGVTVREPIEAGTVLILESPWLPFGREGASATLDRILADPAATALWASRLEGLTHASHSVGGSGEEEPSARLRGAVACNSFAGGVYPRTARVNHSCHPNCIFREGEALPGRSTLIELRATSPIPMGGEVTVAYRSWESELGPDTLPWALTHSRREELRRDYGFVCGCELCEAPGELEACRSQAEGRSREGEDLMEELARIERDLATESLLPTAARRRLLKLIPQAEEALSAGHILLYRSRGLLVQLNQELLPDYPHPGGITPIHGRFSPARTD